MFANVKKKFSIIICCRPIPLPCLPRSFTAALPCSYPRKVVSHSLAGMNLSSCIASHHNSHIWKTEKHRKTLTTQAGFLLSEDQPLTVLGSSMMLHHCLRLRDLSMGIFSCDDCACSDYRIYVCICQEIFSWSCKSFFWHLFLAIPIIPPRWWV